MRRSNDKLGSLGLVAFVAAAAVVRERASYLLVRWQQAPISTTEREADP